MRMKPAILMLLAALIGAGALLPACRSDVGNDRVTIAIYLDTGIRFTPLTITPDIPLEVSEYRVYGAGPVSSVFEIVTGERSCVAEGLLPGEWTIGAEGFNTAGTLLFSGDTVCAIDRETETITIHLTEPSGEGALHLTFTWEEGLVADPALTVTLSKEGAAVLLNPVITAGAATADATLQAGLYEMTALLSSNGEQLAGAADYLKIIAGYETRGSIALKVSVTPVSPQLALNVPKLVPLEVAIGGYDPPVFTGRAVTLYGAAEAGAAAFKWFVDGAAVAAGGELIADTSNPGTRRIDLLATAEGFSSGGSVSLELTVYDPVFYGSLVFIESIFDNHGPADGLSAARALALSDGYLYTAGYGEDEIGVYGIDETTGKLTFVETVGAAALPEPGILRGPSCLAPIGSGLAAGCAKSGVLILFAIDGETGSLTYLDSAAPVAVDFAIPLEGPPDIPAEANPLASVSGIAWGLDGDIIYAAGAGSNTITSYKIEDGVITPYQIVSGETLIASGFDGGLLGGPEEVAVSPDGALLAAACRQADSLVIFEIGAVDGVLAAVAAFVDEIDGVDGLNGAGGVSFSPDGRDIYVTGYYDNAVSLFSKDTETGVWSFIAIWKESDLAGAALRYPRGVVVSPDGSEVYVCAGGSDAFTVFARDAETGILSSPVSAVNGDDRNVGLDGVRKTVVGGAGEFVYAVSSNDSAAALFRRE